MKPHYWLGQWIDDAELERNLGELPELIADEMSRSIDTEAVVAAASALGAELGKESVVRSRLTALLLESGQSEADASAAFVELSSLLSRGALERKLRRELGGVKPLVVSRIAYEDALFEAWAPLGFLVHVSPRNSFAVGAMSVLEGLLTGNFNFLKTGGEEGLFAQTFLEALCELDLSKQVRGRVIVARISSRRSDLLRRIFALADGIAAWGGEEAVQSIRAMAPPQARVVAWGHKISFIYVSSGVTRDDSLLERIARECCLLEQQACSSPQCIYLDSADFNQVTEFSKKLGAVLERVSREIPLSEPGDSEAAEITMTTEAHRAHSAQGHAGVLEGRDGSWRIFTDERSGLVASPLYRSIWIKPLQRAEIVAVLRPMRAYLQTCGLECGLNEVDALSRALIAAGVERVRRIGEMLGGYSGEPHDGVYALTRYSRRVTLQLGESSRGISTFDELKKLPSPFAGDLPAITPKEKFESSPGDTRRGRLFFKSGGSSGDPKLSAFTYDQYHEQMRLGAEGLYAAGFDPVSDRSMNLFFGGGLYGGFTSFFSALEVLEAVQFPMAAHMDFEMVVRTIIKSRVNVILGMPSYILQLFDKGDALLAGYRGIEKIFYGGEHFSETQKKHLKDRYGVRLIRSGAYGSVDIGPIGFQCGHCEGGVHHLQQRLQYLEILKLHEDRPVVGEEVGRLIFTPRALDSGKPLRYEIGDVGNWVSETGCPCGRSSPRFKLLGRMGDIFRIGSMFLNYQKFAQLLSSEAGYSGEVQVVLGEESLREKVTLLVSDGDSEALRRLCLENYPDLNEAVLKDGVLLFEIKKTSPDGFERTKGSGKLVRVIDRRQRA